MSELSFRLLEPSLAEELMDYLGGAFPDNPSWASCFCLHYNVCEADGPWDQRNAAQNRAEKKALIDTGMSTGVLAYSGDRVVGWCHAAPRHQLRRLAEWEEAGDGFRQAESDRVGAIVCYVIAPDQRRRGIATALLEEACALLADMNMESVEAYPQTAAPAEGGALSTDARSYHGSLSMYVRAGFERLYELNGVTIMRRRLGVLSPAHDSGPASS